LKVSGSSSGSSGSGNSGSNSKSSGGSSRSNSNIGVVVVVAVVVAVVCTACVHCLHKSGGLGPTRSQEKEFGNRVTHTGGATRTKNLKNFKLKKKNLYNIKITILTCC
jgi:hypothetical protein